MHTGFYSERDICGLTTLSRVTIWRMVRRSEFPKPAQLSPKRVGWPRAIVDKWLGDKSGSAEAADDRAGEGR